MDYSKLSDFEINIKVAVMLGYDLHDCYIVSRSEAVRLTGGQEVDYCNNPSDAWPVIVENRICITFGAGAGSALRVRGGNTYQYVASKYKMLRAAMIVFLMMSEK